MANQQLGLFRRLTGTLSRLLATKATPPAMQSGWGRSWNILSGGNSDGAYSNTPSDWMSAAQYFVWVTNCVAARANAISSVPLKLYKRSDDPEEQDPEEQTDHPILDLLRQVNELNLDEASFKREGERNLCVHGEWVTSVSTGSDGKPVELYILQPAALLVNRDPISNYPTSYLYGGRVTFLPEQLIRIYYPRLDDPVLAQSPTATAIAAVNRYTLADQAQETLDKSGGLTRGIIGVDFATMALDNGDSGRFMTEWNAKKLNPARQHEDMFLPAGMTRENGVLSAQEQERELRMDRLKKEVFAAFNVPPAMAGDYSDASVLANADQQERNFWAMFGKAELGLISEGLNTQLLWRYWPQTRDEGLYLAFDTSGVAALQENRLEVAQLEAVYAEVAGARYSGMVTTLNEAREYLGLEKINDPRADKIAFPDTVPAEGAVDENGNPIVKPLALSGDNMSQVRQVTRDYQVKKYTRSQAESLIRIAAPEMTDEALDTLLTPADQATAEVKSELEITELRPVVDALDAYNQDMLSEPQARLLLKMALPAADEAMLNKLLERPASRVAEQAAVPTEGAPDTQTDVVEDVPVEDAPEDGEAEIDEPSPEDIALDEDTATLLDEAVALGAAKAFKPRDPDSIKRGPDGKFAPDPNADDNKPAAGRVNYNTVPKGKKGKAKKPKMNEAEKAAKRAAAKLKRDTERATKLQGDMDALRQALQDLEGKDDPSNLRKRISQQIERVQARLDALKTGRESSTQKLLNEAATKAEAHAGAMVALMLPATSAQQLLDQVKIDQPDAVMEPAETLHITLAYLGKAALLSDWTRSRIVEIVAGLASETAVPLSFTVKGSGRFTNPSGDALWAGVGVEGLQELRECLVERLRNAGINVPLDHGDYQPHITLAYLPSETAVALPGIQPVRVDLNTLTVMLAGERMDFPLGTRFSMPNAENEVTSVRFVSAKAMPMAIVDFVGMNAIDAATGTPLGAIEKIARFGEHVGAIGTLTATKAEPVVYVNGTVYRAADVRVIAEESN